MLNYFWSINANAIRSVLNWITIKILLISGPAGAMGLWGQIQNLTMIGSSITNFSSATAVTKGVANKEKHILEKISQLTIVGSFLLLILILVVVQFEVDDLQIASPILIYLISIAMGINAILLAILVAQGAFKKIFIANILSYGILPSSLLIYNDFDFKAIVLSLLCGVFFSNIYLIKSIALKLNLRELLTIHSFGEYMNIILIGGASLTNVIVFNYVIFSSRALLKSNIEIDYYEVLIRTFLLVEGFVVMPLTLMFWSKVAQFKGDVDRNKEIIKLLMKLILLLISISIILYYFRNIFLETIFSSKMLEVENLIIYSIFILVVKSIAGVLVMALMLRNLQVRCILNDIIFAFSFLIILSLMDASLGNIMIALLIAYIFYSIWPFLSFLENNSRSQ